MSELTILTAADSERMQRATAAHLHARGIARGDRIALMLPGSTDLVSCVLGALRAGVVPVMLDPALSHHEREFVLSDSVPSLVIDSVAELHALVDTADALDADLASVPLGRPMHYTSGTSGRRKGVWSGVLEQSDAEALVAEEIEQWGFAASDRHLVSSLMYHSAPLRFAMNTLLVGGTIGVLPKFTALEWVAAVDQMRPTTMFLAPAHLSRIQQYAHESQSMPDLSSVRLVAYAGAPCPAPVQEWAHDVFPPDTVWEFYGSTEGQFTACSPSDSRRRPGSVGRARIGRELMVDENSVIWCRAPEHAQFTYWGDAEKTAGAWRGEWFTVGDLGRLDDDGFLYLEGRRDDLILSGGVNVYPREVEVALETCPGVIDVAVTSLPDEQWGERVVAVIVGDVSEDALRNWATRELSPPRRPKEYVFSLHIPRTSSGKLRRRSLLDEVERVPQSKEE